MIQEPRDDKSSSMSASEALNDALLHSKESTDAINLAFEHAEELDQLRASRSSVVTNEAHELLREARGYVAAVHQHITVLSADAPFVQEPCSRCELRKRIDAELNAPRSARVENDRWLVAQEHVTDTGEPRPKLGYVIVHEWPTFETAEAAHDFLGERNLPLGWVVMKESQLRQLYVDGGSK